MKVRVSSIPYDGLVFQDKLPLEALNERMRLGASDATQFCYPPKVDIALKHTRRGAALTGKISSVFRQPCALCDEGIERSLEVELNYLLLARQDNQNEDDIGTIFFDGDIVDLEEVLQEALIVKLFPFWHPELKDDGSCSLCGQLVAINSTGGESGDDEESSNEAGETQNFGELLKRASKKGKG